MAADTFKVLNKDFRLVMNEHGKYDRVQIHDDLEVVEGLESLRVGCIFALLLIPGELRNNHIYKDEGCMVWSMVKANMTRLNIFKAETYAENTLEGMSRVYEVISIEAFEREDKPGTLTIQWAVIGHSDRTRDEMTVLTGEVDYGL